MNSLGKVAIGTVVHMAGGIAFGFATYCTAMNKAKAAWARLHDTPPAPVRRFNNNDIADYAEITQRNSRHAIALGTPIYSGADLEMEGAFLMVEKSQAKKFRMSGGR